MAYLGEVSLAPSPVMTFEASGSWLAVRVEQVDRVAMAPRLWPVPLARPEHVGLFDTGQELVPVLNVAGQSRGTMDGEQLVAVLHVRGETVGLAIDRAGRLLDRYRLEDGEAVAPGALGRAGARAAHTADTRFWLVDADRLFDEPDVMSGNDSGNDGLSPGAVKGY